MYKLCNTDFKPKLQKFAENLTLNLVDLACN